MPSTLLAGSDRVTRLLAEDRRYKYQAYQFVEAGLAYSQDVLGLGRSESTAGRQVKSQDGRAIKHVSGQELCWALKELAHRQYGLLAKLVLESWGIHSTSDFGEIVYNLIRVGKLSKSDRDRRSDFDDVFDFHQTLLLEYAICKE